MPVRLDIWLDVACLFKTRSEAQRACKGGKVDLNGHSARQNREIKPGDVIEITRPAGRRQRVVVLDTTEKHVPKAQARALYQDTTPPPRRKNRPCSISSGWPVRSGGRPRVRLSATSAGASARPRKTGSRDL
jgi:ribosomal 50S subunit-recycling heat shock protein